MKSTYKIELITNCPAYALGLNPHRLLKNGIEIESHINDDQYLSRLKNRLEKGEGLNWWTKFKAKLG